MNEQQLEEILNRHVNALIEGQDLSDELLGDRQSKRSELAELLQLAVLLKEHLVPKKVPAFRERLRQALEYQAPTEIALSPPTPIYKKVLMALAAMGSVISIAGLYVFIFRRRRSAAGVVVPTA